MGEYFKHSVVALLLGILLASVAWFLWWIAGSALGVDGEPLAALALSLFVGGLAGLAGVGCIALFRRKETPTETPTPAPVVQPTSGDLPALKKKLRLAEVEIHRLKRRPRRLPLDRGACLARISPALRWQSMSKSLRRLLQGDHRGHSVLPMLHPEDVPAVDLAFAQARTGKGLAQVLCRWQSVPRETGSDAMIGTAHGVDTEVLPTLTSGLLVSARLEIWARRDRAGKVLYYLCRFTDLTSVFQPRDLELKFARKMMSRAKRKLRSVARDMNRLKVSYFELYHNAPVMYFSLDKEGRLVTFNDTLLRTLGYQRKDLQNQSYTTLLAPETLKSYVAIAQSMPSQQGESETTWRKKDGSLFDVWLHTVTVYDEQGRFVRHRSAALDLSDKNRLANELRARGDELERTNQRLRTINGELEAFTHVVSHDLKEPLRTLQAYSHLLAEENAAQLGPDGFQYINHLIRASRRLGALIDELLNLSQAGRITRDPKVFNINEVVATVRQDLVDLIQRKEAIILTEGSLPDVIGDPVRITQLLANLVANGLKYNQNHAPKVMIGATVGPDGDNRATIFVRDNGIGIDPAFHQQIFGIFRRLHQGDEYEGTGAGLAICRKIVEGHGGRIWVESQLGAGATFYFTLPRSPSGKPAPPVRKSKPESPSSRQRKAASPAESGNGRPRRIVLVEDQTDVALIIQKLGKRDGLNITWFPTGEEAWAHLQKHGADLLLFDVNLPGISGIELCRRIRAFPPLQETPVAMFTPDHDIENLQALRDAGADFFLTKDLLCEPAVWQKKIQELIEQIGDSTPH